MQAKKLLAMLFAALLLFTACASDKETAETQSTADTSAQTTESSDDQLKDNLPDVDMEGYTYVMCINGNDERVAHTYVEDLNGEIINDAVYTKLINTEGRFNTEIVMSELRNPDDDLQAPKNSIVSGDDAFDLLQGHDIKMAMMSLEGLFYNLYDVPHLDMTQPWWPESTTESMTVAGQMYMMFNNISYTNLAFNRVMFFNKDMMTDLGMEYPYNMVYEGTWTLDSMLKIVDAAYKDTNGDGKKDNNDLFGYVSFPYYYGVMEPFKLEPYQKDEDGNLHYNLDLENMMKLTEKYYALLFGQGGYVCKVAEDATAIFTAGNALFMYAPFSDAITQFSYGDVVYGLLPMPKLDETQDGYYGGSNDRPLALPITAASHLENTAIITESLNIEGYRQVFPAYYETAMKSRYADQTDDAAMMELIHDNVIISFTYMFGEFKSAYNVMFENLFNLSSPGTDVASWAAKNEKTQIEHVEKLQKFFDDNRKG